MTWFFALIVGVIGCGVVAGLVVVAGDRLLNDWTEGGER